MYFYSRLLRIHEETINIACNLSSTLIAQFTQPADPRSLLSQRGQEEHKDGRRIIAQYTSRTPKSTGESDPKQKILRNKIEIH